MPYGSATGTANDEDGNWLFYTTGCRIMNRNLEVMENGDDIDSGADNIESCPFAGIASYIKNGTFIFPDLKNINIYNIYYLRSIRTSDTSNLVDRLYKATIDPSANNGLGRVVEKNQVVLSDSLHNQIAVTRHGNGRDWWMVVRRGVGREFHRILLTPEGEVQLPVQDVAPAQPPFSLRFEYADEPGTFWIPPEYAWEVEASSAFSPDGSKYCEAVLGTGYELYDFDRCTGDLRFRRLLPIPDLEYASASGPTTIATAVGMAFSPNNRYLYVHNGLKLFQLDLCEECLEKAPLIEIGTYDGYTTDGFAATFYNMRNTPDGKIYMGTGNSTKVLHVIHEPDRKGKACRFEQHAVHLPRYHTWILNNFPNFNLFDLKGSPCDTLGIDDPLLKPPAVHFDALSVYPNPANRQVQIFFPECQDARIEVWNAAGQWLWEITHLTGNEVNVIDVSAWPSGLYVLKIYIDGQEPVVRKVVVAR